METRKRTNGVLLLWLLRHVASFLALCGNTFIAVETFNSRIKHMNSN